MHKKTYIFIFISALILVTPQILTKSVVLGSDSIFHFNRFYDAGEQIRNLQFNFFIHIYGFQQSGRIVNAIYGPAMSYFQGFLVLISPSWLVYQVISNFILYSVSGLCMSKLLRSLNVKEDMVLVFSIFFMTSYSIQYWVIRQGFTSWGAAFLPLCLIPIVDFVNKRDFHPYKVAFCMALMAQIHLFTAVILASIYIFYFFIVIFFIKNVDFPKLIHLVAKSIVLFVFMTLNLWGALYHLYTKNDILGPFINRTMFLNTITANSYYWLINPFFLLLVIFGVIFYDVKNVKKYGIAQISTLLLYSLLFILSTNLIPWEFLSRLNLLGVRTIQFPFRFFVPFTILVIAKAAWILSQKGTSESKKKILQLVLLFSIVQSVGLISLSCYKWNSGEMYQKADTKIINKSKDNDELKYSFLGKNKQKALELLQKSTPDYLPLYKETDSNKYEEYKKYIINNVEGITKRSGGNKIVVSWNSDISESKTIPVITYKDTKLELNKIEINNEDLKFTEIGNPVIKSKKGKNVLIVSYKTPNYFYICFGLSLIVWTIYLIRYLTTKINLGFKIGIKNY